MQSVCIIQVCATISTQPSKTIHSISEIAYRVCVLYRFVLTAAHRQPSKTIHFMSEITCRVCVLYRCVLPAAHRQPSHSGQSQQGGTRVHRVQAILGRPRSGGHVGSRGPHQQPQRYGEVVLSGKRLNPKILLYVKSTCKTNLYIMEMIVINPVKPPSTENATYSDNSFLHFRVDQIGCCWCF